MKKLFTLLLFTLTALPSIVLADIAPEPDVFTDVQEYDDAYWEIRWLKEDGILSGYPDGSFHPDDTINRAEFSKILAIAAYEFDAESADFTSWLDFYDIDQDAWYAPYLHKLYDENVISGYSDKSFKPDNDVNFAEAAKMTMLAFDSGELSSNGAWYQPYVDMVEDLGATPESITSPDQLITRAEMAVMIYETAQAREAQ